jgi:hydrogenase maturation protease
MTDAVRRIADAVLYEGYLLWPYRRSALKNQRRWTFGGVYPEGHSRGREDDPCVMRTACLLEGGPDATVDVRVRWLHVVRRQVLADGEPVDEVVAGGERRLSWDEATEREAGPGAIAVPAGQEVEDVGDGAVVVRSWEPLAGRVEVADETLVPGLRRIAVAVVNTTPWHGGPREEALRRTFCSTHVVLRARGGLFVSTTDPPERLREAAAACRNEGAWPVLVGAPGDRDTVLASPIILEDHPQIAPESPGDLFDGGEIDGLLTLSILGLTDEEKAEMRASDPRAREILERTEALTGEELLRLHGRLTDLRAVRER